MIHLFKSPSLSFWNTDLSDETTIYIDTKETDHQASELAIHANHDHTTASQSDDYYLSKAISHRKYEISDFSFFWDQSDGSPLFIK